MKLPNMAIAPRAGSAHFRAVLAIMGALLLLSALNMRFSSPAFAEEKIMVFAGAASKPPTEEICKLFEQKTGVKVDVVFGGSGYILSQMALAKQGDVYFPGSSDFMEIAKKKGFVYPETEKIAVYLVSAINVQKGNPHGIKTLQDLARPGLRVAIANPEGVCVGAYAVEIIEKNFTPEQKEAFRKNLANYTESCEKTATAISMKAVDAVVGWRVFQYWDPERIETIPLKPSEIIRIGYIPLAVATFTQNKELAQKFIDFVLSEDGKAVFAKYHYFKSAEDASEWIGEKKPVGGEYVVPAEWIKK